MLDAIFWDINPEIFHFGPFSVRWYGLLYAMGFLVAITLLGKIFKHEGAPEDWLDKVFIYIILAVIVGARLGHCCFYEWDYYSAHPLEILQIWKGGLASHGGALMMLVAVWFLSKFMTKLSFWWLGDRLFVVSALVACLIRCGNLMNSEIYGPPTDLPWGFIFARGDEYPGQACHPTQIYEGLAYITLFFVLLWLYWKRDFGRYNGLLSGIGFTWVFTARFFIEFIKNDQVVREANMTLNIGQMLSLPFIAFGIFLIIRALKKGEIEYKMPKQVKK